MYKCIQQAGEVIFVPENWPHEIFNLEPTVGVQAMMVDYVVPSDEGDPEGICFGIHYP